MRKYLCSLISHRVISKVVLYNTATLSGHMIYRCDRVDEKEKRIEITK